MTQTTATMDGMPNKHQLPKSPMIPKTRLATATPDVGGGGG
ncbi:hypothetical protein [Nonomuraea sp. NPDC049784]